MAFPRIIEVRPAHSYQGWDVYCGGLWLGVFAPQAKQIGVNLLFGWALYLLWLPYRITLTWIELNEKYRLFKK